MRRVLQDGGFRSDWGNPDYDPIGDFKETAGDEYRIPLLKVLLREQLESRYEVANHFSTMNRARVELSAFIQSEGGYDISVESHDCTSGRNALAADAPARDAPGKDDQNIE